MIAGGQLSGSGYVAKVFEFTPHNGMKQLAGYLYDLYLSLQYAIIVLLLYNACRVNVCVFSHDVSVVNIDIIRTR